MSRPPVLISPLLFSSPPSFHSSSFPTSVSTSYRLELMTPFQVQCAARASSVEDALRRMEGAAFVMEQKVDGERYVLHKRGMELRLVSRNFNVRVASVDGFIWAASFGPQDVESVFDSFSLPPSLPPSLPSRRPGKSITPP
jgi:hypothetical protein